MGASQQAIKESAVYSSQGGERWTFARVKEALSRIRRFVSNMSPLAVTKQSRTEDPFRVLISCLISLRTRDEVTDQSSRRLFRRARTPRTMAKLDPLEIARLIYPAGFYRTKGRVIRDVSKELLLRFGGEVPDSIDELLTLKGVGRKTANLVVTLGYGLPGICVDTHVHRISNRLGLVRTKTPKDTEMALRSRVPPPLWLEVNDLLVTFGRHHCTPLSPRCGTCVLSDLCERLGVERFR